MTMHSPFANTTSIRFRPVLLAIVISGLSFGQTELARCEELGQSGALTIQIPTGAIAPVQFAAQELQRYLAEMTGGQIEIRETSTELSVPGLQVRSPGSAPPPLRSEIGGDPETDSFLIQSSTGALLIAGSNGRSVLFGVYAFLETLGCRWFGPGEEFIPKIEEIRFPDVSLSETAVLRWRGLELIAGITPAMVDWMAKSRINVVWPETYVPLEDVSVNERAVKECAVEEIRKRGLAVFWGGHILPQLFPESRYGKEHPEYFALMDETRLNPDAESAARWQLCTSNPEVMRILCENVVLFLRNHPWIDTLFLWGNDTVRWCECSACRLLEPNPDRPSAFGGLDRSASYCRMVRAVSNAVSATLPGRRIAFNHYYNLEDLPKDDQGNVIKDLLPSSDVLSAVDDYRQCDRHAFTDPTCTGGKRIEPIARMWAPHFPQSVGWTYYFAWNFTLGLPVVMGPKMAADFKHFRELGLVGLVDNVSLHPSSLYTYNNRLNYYVYARASWNPDLDVESVQEDFIHHYYGPAAGPMQQYWDLTAQCWTRFGMDADFMPEDERMGRRELIHGRQVDALDVLLTEGEPRSADPRLLVPNRIKYLALKHLLREAAVLAGDDPQFAFRVGLLASLLDRWDKSVERPYRIGGFLNGGADLIHYLYHGDDEVSCSVAGGGGGEGDFLARRPEGVPVLNLPGDEFKVEVRINYGISTIGESTYRSGPGIYHAEDEITPCGQEGHNSVMLFIGNVDGDDSGSRRVIALISHGKFQTEIASSPDHVWEFGDYVRLRVRQLGSEGSSTTYAYEYQRGEEWVEVCQHTFEESLPFAAAMHRWAGYEKGANARFPLLNWADIRFVTDKG